MATSVRMKHPTSGLTKTGYIGFSWTTLLFGFFPALFRGDYITFIGGFVITFIIALVTLGFGAFLIHIIWAFMYNKYFTSRLCERGYVFDDLALLNETAAQAMGIDNR